MLRPVAAILVFATGAIAAGEYSHRIWRIEDGLPQNRIRALCQTPDGYLWIGTPEGLARFDGVRFSVFNHSSAPALRDDGVLSLLVAHDGALWIGTEGGGLVRYQRGVFRNFGPAEGLSNGFVRAVYEDRRHTLWIGTDRGFFRLEDDRLLRLDNTPEVPLATITGIGEGDDGRIWAGSPSALFVVSDNILRRAHADCERPARGFIHPSGRGFVWAIGNAGVMRLSGGCAVGEPVLPGVLAKSVAADDDGSLWIGTMGHGLIRYRNGAATPFTVASGLAGNTVNVVFRDSQQNLWVGCDDGLVRLSRATGANIGASEGLEDDDVLTVYADQEDRLWIATLTGQVYRVSGERVERYRLPAPASDLPVRSVYEDRAGAMWFGTLGRGVIRRQGNAVRIFTKSDGLRSNTVRQILEDREGGIWLALDSGVSRWDGHAFTNYYLEDGLSYPSTRCMLVDAHGDILVGTDAGLNRIHDGRIVRDSEFAALSKEKIWSMYLDSAGAMWLGTRGGGLLRFRNGKLLRFSRESGLLTDTVLHILEDGRQRLWMSTSTGLLSADRKELDAAPDVGKPSIHVIPYGAADGLATSQMNGGLQSAGARTASGELWFPSVKGAVHIQPPAMPGRRHAPLLIERIVADDRPETLADQVIIPPGHGRLAIDFTVCEFVNPQRFTFRYKLEGLDDDWTDALRERTAYYTNLPPGRYRFRVIARDAASSDASEVVVALVLRPAFYRTTWFLVLLGVAVAGAVWGGFALYARQTRARYTLLLEERTRLAREMHDTVIQGCVGVSTLLEAAARYRDVDGAEGEALVDQARVEANNTLEEARQAVWNLRHPEAEESAATLLFDLARKLGGEHGIEIATEMEGASSPNPEIDRTLLLVGREALRNAVAHAQATRISLAVRSGPSEVIFEVADNGVGFDPEAQDSAQHRHFGIVGMRERVERLGGVFSLSSTPGGGTRVVGRLPRRDPAPRDSTTRRYPAEAL